MDAPAHVLPASMPPPVNAFDRALRIARLIHPFPTLLNVAATAGLACIAVRGVPEAAVLTRMALVMLFAQSAIGAANDVVDRYLDAIAKPWKAVASGLVPASVALALAVALAVAALALAMTLGARSLALVVLGLACGLAYDVRLKRTPLSALPYMAAIPTLPAWVWVTLDRWQPQLWWLLPLGALIGISLHLANTLPDLDADRAAGIDGLPHRIGLVRSLALTWGAFAGALALSVALAPVLSYDWRWYAPALALGCAALGGSGVAFAHERDARALQLGWGVLSLASAALAAGWLGAVT